MVFDPKKSFEAIAMPHLESIYRAAVALCGRTAQADDLTQMTFLKAIENFASFTTGTNCKAWLLKILRNAWIDQFRKSQGQQSQPLQEQYVAAEPEMEETVWSNAWDILDNFSDEQVIQALSQLPDDQRLALFLADVEQLTLEEVAKIMDVPAGTIKSRTSRARAFLRRMLRAHAKKLGLGGRKT